jgi:hypothetical protein
VRYIVPFIYVEFSDPVSDYFEASAASFSMKWESFPGGIFRRAQSPDLIVVKADQYLSSTAFEHCCQGTIFPWVRVEFYKTAESGLTFLYTMNDVSISSYNLDWAGGVNLSLKFAKNSAKSYDSY